MSTETVSSNIEDFSKRGIKELMETPSVGKAITLKIEEYLDRKVQYLEELRSDKC